MPANKNISAVIITKNEENDIEQCIRSAQTCCDEVIVVDSLSTDKTVSIAKKLGAKVIESPFLGYAETKNLGNASAKNDLVLSLDADEILSEELVASIQSLKETEALTDAYSFNRLNNYCGKWIKTSGWYPDKKIRIFPKSIRWQGEVHETIKLPKEVKVRHLEGDILHYSIATKAEHIAKEKKYASLAKPYPNVAAALIAAVFKFTKMFVFKRGFLDGKLGFQLALITAKAKLWRKKST